MWRLRSFLLRLTANGKHRVFNVGVCISQDVSKVNETKENGKCESELFAYGVEWGCSRW